MTGHGSGVYSLEGGGKYTVLMLRHLRERQSMLVLFSVSNHK